MRVGNVEVRNKGATIELLVHDQGPRQNWNTTFSSVAEHEFDAELRVHALYDALSRARRVLQREVLDNLERRQLPGVRRGKLRRAINAVRSIYGL